MCNLEDVSKKGDETGKSCSEPRRSLFSLLFFFFFFFVHVLVKLGGRCGSRCRLLNYTVSIQ